MRFIAVILLALTGMVVQAQDPNFYVYLCFGQSNMEGNADVESVDREYVDPRFQMLAAVDFSNPQRTMGQWYTAYPPIVRQWTRLGMADYFGRTMVAALPQNVKVGVVDVAIGGVDIKGFMQEEVANYLPSQPEWMKSSFAAYNDDPYGRLVNMARIAQQKGVIKGILLHQGETNNGQQDWPQKVKTVYERLLSDLSLSAQDVPLFVGEVVGASVGGSCSLHNSVIAKVPSVIPTAHVISSEGCPCQNDHLHFTSAGYRTMGKRYAIEALKQLGVAPQVNSGYNLHSSLKKLFTATAISPISDVTLKVGGSRNISVKAIFEDGHEEDVFGEATFSQVDGLTISDGMLVATKELHDAEVNVSYTDFTGHTVSTTFHVTAQSSGGVNRLLVVDNGSAGTNPWDRQAICTLMRPMVKGRSYVVKATMKAQMSGDCALWPIWSTSPNRNQWNNSDDVQYLASQGVTTVSKELTWEFQASFDHDKLQFVFGLIGGKVSIDDVSCVEKSTGEELVANGTFDSDDTSNWEVLAWAGQKFSVEDDATTGISHVTTAKKRATDAYYDLSGRRVAHPDKGVFIVNGKIVVR